MRKPQARILVDAFAFHTIRQDKKYRYKHLLNEDVKLLVKLALDLLKKSNISNVEIVILASDDVSESKQITRKIHEKMKLSMSVDEMLDDVKASVVSSDLFSNCKVLPSVKAGQLIYDNLIADIFTYDSEFVDPGVLAKWFCVDGLQSALLLPIEKIAKKKFPANVELALKINLLYKEVTLCSGVYRNMSKQYLLELLTALKDVFYSIENFVDPRAFDEISDFMKVPALVITTSEIVTPVNDNFHTTRLNGSGKLDEAHLRRFYELDLSIYKKVLPYYDFDHTVSMNNISGFADDSRLSINLDLLALTQYIKGERKEAVPSILTSRVQPNYFPGSRIKKVKFLLGMLSDMEIYVDQSFDRQLERLREASERLINRNLDFSSESEKNNFILLEIIKIFEYIGFYLPVVDLAGGNHLISKAKFKNKYASTEILFTVDKQSFMMQSIPNVCAQYKEKHGIEFIFSNDLHLSYSHTKTRKASYLLEQFKDEKSFTLVLLVDDNNDEIEKLKECAKKFPDCVTVHWIKVETIDRLPADCVEVICRFIEAAKECQKVVASNNSSALWGKASSQSVPSSVQKAESLNGLHK